MQEREGEGKTALPKKFRSRYRSNSSSWPRRPTHQSGLSTQSPYGIRPTKWAQLSKSRSWRTSPCGNGAILRGSNGPAFSLNQGHIHFYHNTNSPQSKTTGIKFNIDFNLIFTLLIFLTHSESCFDSACFDESFIYNVELLSQHFVEVDGVSESIPHCPQLQEKKFFYRNSSAGQRTIVPHADW